MTNGKANDLAIYAEIIGTIAVVISLVFVVKSIDQNTRAIEAAEMNNINTGWRDAVQIPILTDPQLADLVAKARSGESLSSGELIRWRTFVSAKMDIWYQIFNLHQSGVVSDEAWKDWEGGFWVHWETDDMASMWPDERSIFDPDFQRYIDTESSRLAN